MKIGDKVRINCPSWANGWNGMTAQIMQDVTPPGNPDRRMFRVCTEESSYFVCWDNELKPIDPPAVEPTVPGAWLVFGHDMNAYPIGLYATEVEALRCALEYMGKVIFWPFGRTWEQARKEQQ